MCMSVNVVVCNASEYVSRTKAEVHSNTIWLYCRIVISRRVSG